MKTNVQSSAHAKVILIGEHSVIYDKSAVVMPITNLTTDVNLILDPNSQSQTINSDLFTGDYMNLDNHFAGLHQMIETLLDNFSYRQGFELIIKSKIPISRGLGSSASVAAAVTRAFFDAFEQVLNQETLIKFVKISEDFAHGNSSNIDAVGVSSKYIVDFNQNQITQIKNPPEFFLVIVDSKIKGSTKEAVEKVAQHSKKDFLIKELSNATNQFQLALEKRDINQLANLTNQAQGILKQLGVSHPIVDQLVEIAMDNQAIGAKLSGAGLGGVVIAITEDLTTAEKIKSAYIQANFEDVLIQASNR